MGIPMWRNSIFLNRCRNPVNPVNFTQYYEPNNNFPHIYKPEIKIKTTTKQQNITHYN